MTATIRLPRSRKDCVIALAIIAAVILCVDLPRGSMLPQGEVSSSDVQGDYDAARSRLAGMLVKIQQVEGLVPREPLETVVISLNQALDKLELAKAALAGGFLSQASANITAADSIMTAVSPAIDTLVVQADATRRTNLLLAGAGIGTACVAAVLLLWIKRRHDEKQRRAFLEAEIDYSGDEQAGAPNGGASEKD